MAQYGHRPGSRCTAPPAGRSRQVPISGTDALTKGLIQLICIRKPAGRIFGQTAQDDVFQVLWDGGLKLRRRYHGVAGMRDHGLHAVDLVKRRLTGQQVISDGAQRVDVAPLVQLPAAPRLLG